MSWLAAASTIDLKTTTCLALHASVFRGARMSSLPTNACSTENNIPFPILANHIEPSKFWKVELDRGGNPIITRSA